MKKILQILILTAILIPIYIGIFNISFADSTAGNYVPVCKEIVQYYDPTLDDFEGNTPDNIKQVCNPQDHGAFPSKYIGDFTNLPDPIKNSNQSYSIHLHKYINNSREQCYDENLQNVNCPQNSANATEANGIYYFAPKASIVKAFEITLQQDFMENVDMTTLECDDMIGGAGANKVKDCTQGGVGSLGENADGNPMKFYLEYKENNNNTATLTWYFGQDGMAKANTNETWYNPIVYGINPITQLKQPGSNYADDWYRQLEKGVNFETKPNVNERWSATTTSKIKIKDRYAHIAGETFLPITYNFPDNNKPIWEAITPPAGYQDINNTNYYWFNIGTVTTIWEKPPENVCESLTLGPAGTLPGDNAQNVKINPDAQGVKVTINGKTAYKMPAVNLVFSNEIPQGTKIRWLTLDAAGKFYSNTNGTEIAKVANTQYIDVNINQTIYYVGNGPVWVLLAPTEGNSNIPVACNKLIEIPKPANACEELTLNPQEINPDAAGAKTTINGTIAYKMPTTAVNFTENTPAGTKLQWSSLDINAKFYNSNKQEIPTELVDGGEYWFSSIKMETDVGATIYYSGTGPVVVTVIDANGDYPNLTDCNKIIYIPGEVCEELKVDHPKDIYVGTVSKFNSEAYKLDDTQFGENVTYTVDHGYGLFYTTKPQDVPNNPSSTVYETVTYQGGAIWNYWDVTSSVKISGEDLSVSIQDAAGFSILSENIANGAFFGGYGEGENQQGTTAPPLDTIDFGGASVVNAFTYVEPSQPVIMEPLLIEAEMFSVSDYMIDITAKDLTLMIPDYTLDFSYLNESITVPYGTPVYFVALKPGTKVIHAKAVGSNEGNCERDFDIKEFNVCKEININRPSHIYEKTLSELSAAAVNPIGNSFYGKITYTVDAGYGQFYTSKPAGLTENDSVAAPDEFDDSKPIAAPQGGFCSGGQAVVPSKEPVTEKNPADDSGSGGMTQPPQGGVIFDLNTDTGTYTVPGSGGTYTYEGTLPGSVLWNSDSGIKNEIIINPTNYQSIILEQYGEELFYEVPSYMETGIKPQPSPEPSPAEMGVPDYLNSSVVHAFTLIEEDIIIAAPNGQTTVTVNPGTKVYFWAEKEGTNVVHISANCTDEKNCKRDLSIEKKALTCNEAKLTAHNYDLAANNTAQCLAKNGNYGFSVTFKDDKGVEIPSNKIKVKWTTTDPNGKFESMFPVIWHEDQIEANAFISLSAVKYTGGGQVRAELYELDGKKYIQNNCKVVINPCPEANSCASLQIKDSTGAAIDSIEFNPDLDTFLKATGTDLNGNALPDETKLKWTTDTGAKLSYHANNAPVAPTISETGEIVAKLMELMEFYKPIQAGKLEVVMSDPADPLYSAICKDSVQIIKKEDLPVCTGLELKDNGVVVQSIEPGKLYKLTSTASYSLAVQTPTSDYTSTQGLLFTKDQSAIAQTLATVGINSAEAATLQGAQKSLKKVPDNEEVYFLTFKDAQGDNILTVQATNRSEAICIKTFSIAQKLCQSIKVTYYPQPFDPEKDVVISVDKGDFGDFKGNFKFSAPNGKFYTLLDAGGESAHENPKEFSQTEAKKGVIFTGGQKGDKITITAVGNLAGVNCNFEISPAGEGPKCVNLSIVEPEGKWTEDDFDSYDKDDKEATQKFKIEVTTEPAGFASNLEYKWEVSGGGNGDLDKTVTTSNDANPLINYLRDFDPTKNTQVTVEAKGWAETCSDSATLNVEEKDIPEIEKAVYDTKDQEWTDTLNVGGKASIGDNWKNPKDQYITYLSIFDPGSAKSVEIWDSSLEGGEIDSDINQGTLDFKDMAIAVEGNDGKKYIIYKTDGFNPSRYSDEELDGEDSITTESEGNEKEKFGDNYDEDLEYFADKYNCKDASSGTVCLDYEEEEFDEIYKDFQNGKKIKLSNTDEAEKIYIIYQMENNTKVTDAFCKTMIEKFGVCGEQFDNEINFKAYKDDDFDTELDSGKDEATVIAICPFILAREGGDVFFHDAIDTGIDVSACYEVETCEGPCIKPKPEDTPELSQEGMDVDGDGVPDPVILSTPTHDICKLSNSEDTGNLDSYKNVFKNFSSSVCEMETEVATDWKEKYINEAIKANIEKLSRFEEVTGPVTIAEAQGFMNNGVVVINGNMTVDNGDSAFTISKNDTVPAAQTYIIKGGNLTINSNIKYNDSQVNILNPKTIPSVAFIVIDGNIEISPDVTELDGIYMAVDTEDAEDGQINPTKDAAGEFISTDANILTIRGSLIGDVYNLFMNRRAIGDPLKDESSITVKYDERILLNTPPGLTELIDVNQLKVAN